MATSINCGFAFWLDGGTINALIGRTLDVAALAYTSGSSTTTAVRGGVLPSGGTQALLTAASAGMAVTVNPGYCVVPNSTSAVFGAYRVGMLTQGTLTVATSDPTNPRIDLVVAQVTDNGDATSFSQIVLVTGTPAGIPAPPTAPANSITLAQITVGTGVSVINAGNITDKRAWTVPPGGILPVATASVAPVGQNGSYVHDIAVGRLAHNGAAGVKQVATLPWTRQVAVRTTDLVVSTVTEVTVLTASITVDGSTDIEIFYKWSNVIDASGGATAAAPSAKMNIYIDATRVDQVLIPNLNSTSATPTGGGTGFYQTCAALSTTPAAGAHTVTWKFQTIATGVDPIHLVGATGAPLQLIVKPVCL